MFLRLHRNFYEHAGEFTNMPMVFINMPLNLRICRFVYEFRRILMNHAVVSMISANQMTKDAISTVASGSFILNRRSFEFQTATDESAD